MKFNEEFQVGKHGIGFVSSRLTETYKDTEFVSVFMPTYQKLPRYMTDAQIESELKPGICTLGDVIAFLDNAPAECKDGWANLFYFPSFVVSVGWHGSDWDVYAWERGEGGWHTGHRVFSPATATSGTLSSHSSTLTLEPLHVGAVVSAESVDGGVPETFIIVKGRLEKFRLGYFDVEKNSITDTESMTNYKNIKVVGTFINPELLK